jgi:retinol-binding protein 3
VKTIDVRAGVLMMLTPLALGAQNPPSHTGESADSIRRAIVERVVRNVANVAERSYVFPDTGKMVAEHLRRRLASGAFSSVVELAQLADRLTAEMQSVNADRHLYVTYAGRSAGGSSADQPTIVRRRPGDTPSDEALVWPRRLNYDFHGVQRLAGNVGYLSLSLLSSRGTPESFQVVDAAMAFLAHVDALIIDLRRTSGGEPRLVDYLASYFFEREGLPTLTSYSRSMDRTIERTTVAVPGKRRPAIPLYVLVGPGTASGTEDFSFIMKQTSRGTLVGARTAGAGRLTAMYPVGDGFTASVSGGRTYDPRTGKEWERTGIDPDVSVSDADALHTAHAAAIERIAAATNDSAWKNALEWTRRVVGARARPMVVKDDVARRIAGDYDLRLVRFEDGKLWYHRDRTRPREELTQVDGDSFALGEATRVEFVRDGARVVSMKVITPLGQESIFPRTR